MTNLNKVATSNANEDINVATATNVEQTNSNEMKDTKNLNEQPMAEQEPQFRTVKAKIRGEEKEIILACHKYSMETLKTSQIKQLELIDKSKMLDVFFTLLSQKSSIKLA